MNNEIKIKPEKEKLPEYISSFEKGNLQVPAFQRAFVWSNEKKLELFDSLKRGYPIGSVLLWQPNFENGEDYERFGTDSLGSYQTPKRNANSYYILDGFQRLSTLIGCLIHPKKANQKGIERNEEEWKKGFSMVYNLKDEQFEIPRTKDIDKLMLYQVPIYKLIDGKEFFSFQKSLFNEENAEVYIQRYEEVSLIFQNYEIPSINLQGGTIAEAIDIFVRLNSTGSPITADWIASALSWNSKFRLGTEIDYLLDNQLSKYNYQNLKREIILNCITNSFGGLYFDQVSKKNSKKLENLVTREDFISVTKQTFQAIEQAVAFLFKELYTLDNKFLPYNNQLIFLADFLNKIENPTQIQLDELKKWFWITTYSNYFTIYNLSKQRLAYQEFQSFINDENHDPIYYDRQDERFDTQEFPKKVQMGSVRAKALGLFMLQYQAKGQSLDIHRVNGYKEYRLFQECNNPKDSENTVLIIDDGKHPIDKFTKDLSDWLNSDEDYSAFFITAEMQKAYQNGTDKETILIKRRQLIIEEERKFVESFNIEYIEE